MYHRLRRRIVIGPRSERHYGGKHGDGDQQSAHKPECRAQQTIEDFLRGAGNQEVGEFDQQIREVIDGILGWIRQGVLNVLKCQVEIAAAMNARNRTGGLATSAAIAIAMKNVADADLPYVKLGISVLAPELTHATVTAPLLQAVIDRAVIGKALLVS